MDRTIEIANSQLNALQEANCAAAIECAKNLIALAGAMWPPDELRALGKALQGVHRVRMTVELPTGIVTLLLEGPGQPPEKIFQAFVEARNLS